MSSRCQDPCLQSWIAAVSTYWQRRGVSEEDRARLQGELERDLQVALAEGAATEDLIAVDPGDFAREVAGAHGLVNATGRTDPLLTKSSFVGTALVGVLGGAIASVVLVYPLGIRVLDALPLTFYGEGVFAMGLHVVAACICAVSAVCALRWRFRQHAGIRRSAMLAGPFLLLAGAVSVAPTMAFAVWLDYTISAAVVFTEVVIVLAFCIVGLLAAHWVRTRPTSDPERA